MLKSDRVFEELRSEVTQTLEDDSLGLHAVFALDKSVNGKSVAGVRFTPDASMEEAQDLARAMTLKQGFLGFPRGGARVGVRSVAEVEDVRMQAMINRIGEWLREFVTDRNCLLGQDVGTHARQFIEMYRHLGIHVPKHSDSSINSGLYTSMSVYACLHEAADWVDLDLKNVRIAIEGLGRVGAPLAKALHHGGAKIVAVSTMAGALYNDKGLDISRLLEANSCLEDEISSYADLGDCLEKEKLLELDVDVLCPCGTDSTLHKDNAANVKARLICSGANNPLTRHARRLCEDKGGLVLPDFITNAGGVLGNASAFAGLGEAAFKRLLKEDLLGVLKKLNAQAERQQISLYDLAEKLTLQKADRRQSASSSDHWLKEIGLKCYRRGWIPRSLTRGYAYRSIRNMIQGGWAQEQ